MNIIFVISSPTGVGKTTVCNMESSRNSRIKRVITHTTRTLRPGEKDGVDYFFVSKEKFKEGLRKGEFIEYAVVHGNYYGTSRDALLSIINGGNDALLAIDVQGARNVIRRFSNVVSIFMLPPSFDVWLERVQKDGDRKDVDVRLKTSLRELGAAVEFDYCIINDVLNETIFTLESIIQSQHNRMSFVKHERQRLIDELAKKTLNYLEG